MRTTPGSMVSSGSTLRLSVLYSFRALPIAATDRPLLIGFLQRLPQLSGLLFEFFDTLRDRHKRIALWIGHGDDSPHLARVGIGPANCLGGNSDSGGVRWNVS